MLPETSLLYNKLHGRHVLPGPRERFEFINRTLLELRGLQSFSWGDGKRPLFQGLPGRFRGISDGKGPASRSSGLNNTNRPPERKWCSASARIHFAAALASHARLHAGVDVCLKIHVGGITLLEV